MDPATPRPGQTPIIDIRPPVTKTFKVKFVALVIGLLLIGSGAYAGLWYWQQNETQIPVPTFTPRISPTTGQFCGGIAAIKCPSGYTCKLSGSYPDAGGMCVGGGVACTQEAKQCSDGSYVGRTGSSCAFAPCPGEGTLLGHVTIGPNCPVEQAGHPCTPTPQAYTSRQVYVYKADGITLMTSQNFDVQGNYSVNLSAGTYVIKSRTGISSVPQTVGTVTIKTGQTTTLNFSIDTGIR